MANWHYRRAGHNDVLSTTNTKISLGDRGNDGEYIPYIIGSSLCGFHSLCTMRLFARERGKEVYEASIEHITQVVALVSSLGLWIGVSDTLLGLTVLAWSNCVGDSISNVTIAIRGCPRMAISACIAGPMFSRNFSAYCLCYIIACRSSRWHWRRLPYCDCAQWRSIGTHGTIIADSNVWPCYFVTLFAHYSTSDAFSQHALLCSVPRSALHCGLSSGNSSRPTCNTTVIIVCLSSSPLFLLCAK